MAMQSGRGAAINVTPMIDVLLVLLIIFMTIGPPRSSGLPALAPSPSSADPGDDRPVIVSVAQHDRIEINGIAVAAQELESALAKIFSTRAEKVLFVSGTPDADFADVAQVMDVARGIGIDKVALLPAR